MSGTTLSCSQAKRLPVRPKPVATSAQTPVLEGDLERHLDRGRSGVRVEDLVEDRLSFESGRALHELRGELDGGRRGEPEQRRVPDVLELELDRAVDLRLPVPVDVHPQ